MIVAKLMGGLGNQMFQYSAARALALRNRTSVYLDLSFLQKDPGGQYTPRNFELDQLCGKFEIAGAEILEKFKTKTQNRLSKLFSRKSSSRFYTQQGHGYNKEFEKLEGDIYLNGFWQSEKYFESIRDLLPVELFPSGDLLYKKRELLGEMAGCNSVAVHVRRGDYASLKSAQEYHGVLGMDYYNKAIHLFEADETTTFFIFSDDVQWCRAHFPKKKNIKVMKPESLSSADLFLMSHCKHNIIANSSYSWWSAWLNPNPSKKVIAPLHWFASAKEKNEDIYCRDWIKI